MNSDFREVSFGFQELYIFFICDLTRWLGWYKSHQNTIETTFDDVGGPFIEP